MTEKPLPDISGHEALRFILSATDLTSLEGTDHPGKIEMLCKEALAMEVKGLPLPAAVCVYPPFIAQAKSLLAGSPVKVATTAAGFPSGQLPLELKLQEVEYALREGADEIDVVISRGSLLTGNYEAVAKELLRMRELTRGKILKVILETGELGAPEHISRACEIAIGAGADFLKTSTGKIQPGATPAATRVMLEAIRLHHEKTGNRTGIKVAGGIREPELALELLELIAAIAGKQWLTPALCRFGASSLSVKIAGILSNFDKNIIP